MELGDYEIAAKAKDAFERLSRKVVDKVRPVPHYGELTLVDIVTEGIEKPEAYIALPGDEGDPVPVAVHNVPFYVGDQVRIEGSVEDRYIVPTILPGDQMVGPSRLSVQEQEPTIKRVNDLWCPVGLTYQAVVGGTEVG